MRIFKNYVIHAELDAGDSLGDFLLQYLHYVKHWLV